MDLAQEDRCTPEEERALATTVLARLCIDAQIDGLRFGPVLQLLFTDHISQKPNIPGQVYLNLGSRWMVFDNRPDVFPESADEMPELSEAEQIGQLCLLR